MKFDKKALKKAFEFLPKSYTNEVMNILSDSYYCKFQEQFVNPIEDLLFLNVFGEGVTDVHEAFCCPGNDNGTKPVAWSSGYIVDRFSDHIRSKDLKKALVDLEQLEASWKEFYK